MKFKKILRIIAFTLFIVLACIVPFPINLFRKPNLKKTQIVLVEKHQENDESKDKYYKF